MARPLTEYFRSVFASDVHPYGFGGIADFLGPPPDKGCDWIITNPPFRLAAEFVRRGLARTDIGVAMLCRSVFLEGGERHRSLYAPHPPSDVLIFSERVPMLKGRLEKSASSATSYAWFVWRKGAPHGTHLHWIPPGTRKQLEKPGDYQERELVRGEQ